MAWVAFDRVVRVDRGVRRRRRRGPRRCCRTWPRCASGSTPRSASAASTRSVGAFTQSYGSETLDASVLVIPHVGFLPGSDPRVQGTVAAIEKELLRDGFVLRYATEHGTDGLPGTEGAFLACSFWLADNYAFAGRHAARPRRCSSACSSLRNHLGLLVRGVRPDAASARSATSRRRSRTSR